MKINHYSKWPIVCFLLASFSVHATNCKCDGNSSVTDDVYLMPHTNTLIYKRDLASSSGKLSTGVDLHHSMISEFVPVRISDQIANELAIEVRNSATNQLFNMATRFKYDNSIQLSGVANNDASGGDL